MFVPRQALKEFKKEFPSIYAVCLVPGAEKIIVLCLGENNEKVKTEINNFLKERISSSMRAYTVFSETKLTANEPIRWKPDT